MMKCLFGAYDVANSSFQLCQRVIHKCNVLMSQLRQVLDTGMKRTVNIQVYKVNAFAFSAMTYQGEGIVSVPEHLDTRLLHPYLHQYQPIDEALLRHRKNLLS